MDRRFWHEDRDQDNYGVHEVPTPSGVYFFQRLYDEAHLRSRLFEPLSREPTKFGWFGKRVAGTFHAYERRWLEGGPDNTIDHPRRIAEDYDFCESWPRMPDLGAIVVDKPLDADPSPDTLSPIAIVAGGYAQDGFYLAERLPSEGLEVHATRRTGTIAIAVDRRLIRPSDPLATLAAPPQARRELAWAPRPGIDTFLLDMLDA